MKPPTIYLQDGTKTTADDPRWIEECATRERHLQTLRRLRNRKERADYLTKVAQVEGEEAATRLHARYQDAYTEEQVAMLKVAHSSQTTKRVRIP